VSLPKSDCDIILNLDLLQKLFNTGSGLLTQATSMTTLVTLHTVLLEKKLEML